MLAVSEIFKYLHIPKTTEQPIQAQRLFHGRGHVYQNLHHVTVDWLPPVILITLFAAEPLSEIEILADQLLSFFPDCISVQLQYRYKLLGPIDLIRGKSIQQLIIQENDLRFHLRLGQTRNTGLFLDMKNGRKWVQSHSLDKRVLNLFAYTCGFSVAAVAGKAKSVFNVDMSRAALTIGRENHRLNQQQTDRVSFEKLNILKSFGRFNKRGSFDLLICDPPTFQKGSINIIQDYPKILCRLDEFMAPGATLLLCLNAPELESDFLIEHMTRLAPKYTFLEEIKPPEVYVEAEEKGLKTLCFSDLS